MPVRQGAGRKEEDCGKACQEGATADSLLGIFVLLSFWSSSSTRTTFVAGILTGEVCVGRQGV